MSNISKNELKSLLNMIKNKIIENDESYQLTDADLMVNDTDTFFAIKKMRQKYGADALSQINDIKKQYLEVKQGGNGSARLDRSLNSLSSYAQNIGRTIASDILVNALGNNRQPMYPMQQTYQQPIRYQQQQPIVYSQPPPYSPQLPPRDLYAPPLPPRDMYAPTMLSLNKDLSGLKTDIMDVMMRTGRRYSHEEISELCNFIHRAYNYQGGDNTNAKEDQPKPDQSKEEQPNPDQPKEEQPKEDQPKEEQPIESISETIKKTFSPIIEKVTSVFQPADNAEEITVENTGKKTDSSITLSDIIKEDKDHNKVDISEKKVDMSQEPSTENLINGYVKEQNEYNNIIKNDDYVQKIAQTIESPNSESYSIPKK